MKIEGILRYAGDEWTDINGKKRVLAWCGSEIREEDNFVCPYFCRREEWNEEHPGFGSCKIDLQYGTNVCLWVPNEYL